MPCEDDFPSPEASEIATEPLPVPPKPSEWQRMVASNARAYEKLACLEAALRQWKQQDTGNVLESDYRSQRVLRLLLAIIDA